MSTFRTHSQTILGVVAGVAALFVASPAALAANITVPLDEIKVVTFESPVKVVYVGNPTIADVTVIDSTHVFVLGKSFGSTNIVALDDTGNQTAEDKVTVLNHDANIVTLQRGAGRSTLNCAQTRCEAAPIPGDDPMPYDTITSQVDKHQGQNLKAASGGGG